MRSLVLGAAATAVALLAAAPAAAQSLTDAFTVDELFRTRITISNGAVIEDSEEFGVDDVDTSLDFLDQANLIARLPTYNGTEALTGVLDYRGGLLVASFAQNSPFLTVNLPSIGESITFNGASRQASFLLLQDFLEELEDAEAEDLVRRFLASLARVSPIDPLAGNPGSLQGQMVARALDLSTADSALESSVLGGQGVDEPAWMIGVAGETSQAGRFETERFDARVERAFRVMEGGRTRLKFDLPFSYTNIQGAKQTTGALGASLEIPVIDRRWSLEPRVAYGVVYAPEAGSVGHMLSTSLTSRLLFENVGRGHLVIGNMVGYTTTLPVSFLEEEESVLTSVDPEIRNGVFRNGVAYQYPLKARIYGRSASIRASYTSTLYTGDALFLESVNEIAASLGVRGREGAPRNGYELFRLSGSWVFGDDYDAFNVSLGYRF